jgi:hypothetical protein
MQMIRAGLARAMLQATRNGRAENGVFRWWWWWWPYLQGFRPRGAVGGTSDKHCLRASQDTRSWGAAPLTNRNTRVQILVWDAESTSHIIHELDRRF